MLTYITIGTNDLQAPWRFMTLFLTCLAIHVCLPGPRTGQCGEMKIIRMRGLASVFVLHLTDNPQRRETGQCSHSVQLTRS